MLRKRNVNIKTVKELDAFPKVPEPYVDKTAVGGTCKFHTMQFNILFIPKYKILCFWVAVSIFTICIIGYLIIAETRYYFDSRLQFKFVPDTDIDAKLKINIDITVAMPCGRVGADVLDSTNQNMIVHQSLGEEDTWWELTPEQRSHFEALKHMNSYLREEYHAIHELLWKSNQVTLHSEMPKRYTNYDISNWYIRLYCYGDKYVLIYTYIVRTHQPSYAPNACRIYGTLNVNKVAGNFHITAGKPLSIPRGHIHISAFMTDRDYNFTHRINKFSFGGPSPGTVHPLEGDEKIADNSELCDI